MMTRSAIPFNVTLLELTPQKLAGLKPVTVLDSFDGTGSNFHESGLFSVSIFGKVGDERRMSRFSYIDIKVSVFHPVIHRALVAMKRLYGGIMSGTEYAVWNPLISDFERSDVIHGKTGFQFFTENWKNIVFEETKSDIREQNILLIKKFKDKAMTTKIVVMPAGYRDMEIGDDGRPREDEINVIYRRILAISNTVSESAINSNPDLLNRSRQELQNQFNTLYETIESMIEGKKKLLLGKFGSRRIMNGTRNVITAMDTSAPYLGAPGTVKFNNTVVGLYQALKSAMPIARYLIRNGFLKKVFTTVDAPVPLVNRETLHSEKVVLKNEYFDRWMTDEGIEKVITAFGEENIRHKPIIIEGRYLALIYKGPDGTVKIIQDIDEVPPTRDHADVYPLTFCELLYLSVYTKLNDLPLFLTRYPITGVGSIYPSKTYVKTTIKSETRRELSDEWEPMDDKHIAYEFPTQSPFVNSLVPHSAKLNKLGADFDGDTASCNITYSDESIEEVDNYLSKKKAYLSTDGSFMSSVDVDTVALVLYNLTGD